ncbi:23S rRNA (guanosine(2251)-2'-O)-methyltransferase RlmB [Sphingorhabdus lutea]|uniref:23S rRNA (Guanosine(2251)-2'-O)-methyltransferase RlmB n=1 Tax=Sphingorhabdus lutea TaxID=1913578 RepID=A0A1L3JBC0_9SPHN|nr:RNA methyltransferase [Sphingorhabdus lutea]APG62399.1 23S rRNA (guanosine(2251)-2'-O)-methyltransferase RlmB [Sphingorhabdus lutea]
MNRRRRPTEKKGNNPRFWGRHAVEAALNNPNRTILKLWGTRESIAELDPPADITVNYCQATDMARLVPGDTPHQNIIAELLPLEDKWLSEIVPEDPNDIRPILILDQITDPHNVGAIFRSAAAFNAVAIITQDRHSPAETGTLAKAASGALEIVPWIRVVNIARTMGELADFGYWRIGLSGHAELSLKEALTPGRNALVLGAEGPGMRHGVTEQCDQVAKLPIHEQMESLNVSNAAAIALYAATQG